jgi:phosphoglycolate phosphatase-like HAD superfamily hydrolase
VPNSSRIRSPRLAWLFDIDGTLLVTEGASREAFSRALAERYGIEDNLKDIRFDGRTEPLIVADVLAKHGLEFQDGDEGRFWNAVFSHMREILVPPRGRLLPGAAELLYHVASDPAWVMGLLTGNMTEMARIKLSRFGLEDHFAFGAFGEQAPDRDALARGAVAHVRREYGLSPERCVVIGDTEHDVSCARSAGARVAAVATGTRTRAELEALAPDLVLDALEPAGPLLTWARSLES